MTAAASIHGATAETPTRVAAESQPVPTGHGSLKDSMWAPSKASGSDEGNMHQFWHDQHYHGTFSFLSALALLFLYLSLYATTIQSLPVAISFR